jgi:hypothetical protein
LASNELDDTHLSDDALIETYLKKQQKVERGFRFLKDPLVHGGDPVSQIQRADHGARHDHDIIFNGIQYPGIPNSLIFKKP